MTVASEIARIKTNISNAYDSAEARGATLPEQKNSENLAECIDSITGGNGVLPLFELDNGSLKIKENIDGSGITSLDREDLTFNDAWRSPYTIFEYCSSIKSLNFPDVETVSDIRQCFAFNDNLETVSFPKLTTAPYYGVVQTFRNCPKLTSFNLDSLRFVDELGAAGLFWECDISGRASFPALEEVGDDSLNMCFYNNKSLEVFRFPKLSVIGSDAMYSCFEGCTSLTDVYFNSLTSNSFTNNSAMDGIISDVDGCTLHFPSNLSSVIPTLSGYPNFDGTNTVILYDLPATE